MSEELLQKDLIKNPEKIGTWNFYNIGSTTVKQLKEAGIIRSVDYGSVIKKKVDGIITKQKEVIAIVEYKSPREFNTKNKKDKAILQEIEVARKLNTKLIIATDTQETIWINVATGNCVKDKNGNDLKYLFNPNDKNLQTIISEIIQSINSDNDKILPPQLIDPTGLAKQIWQDVWSVSGATPENCLYTFVELFIFKYLSDLNILKGDFSFDELLKKYDNNETNDVLQFYANIIRPKIKDLFPEGEDKTTIINGAIFVSKDQKAVNVYGTVFKKVLERFRDYGKLEHIDHDFKSKLFESFLKESISKKNWGQFFTPISVVRAINDMAQIDIKEDMKICDPACGVGKFPLEYIKENLHELFQIKNNKIESKVKIIGFDKGFDKDEQKTIILAKANMLIYFCELIKENPECTKEFAKLFNESFVLKTNSILGTLSEPVENEYDLILTNPPYVTSGSSNLKEEIAKNIALKNHYKINAMGVEGLFMEWIIKSLKQNGKAFIVVPDGVFNRQNDKNLRKYILDECFIDAIISLPIKTFFTTPKKTYILVITKKSNKAEIQTHPIFTYICSEIGESRDINRFEIEENDLKEAVELFKSFKGNKKGFSKLNTDKRCKVQPIDIFKNGIESHWIIDKFWSEKEKEELGIIDENKPITLFDFSNVLNTTSDTILSYEESIKQITNFNSFTYVSKKIGNIFSVEKGKSKYTKSYMNKHKGQHPVYSSQTSNKGIIANIDTYDYDCKCLTWTTDGTYVGTVFLRNGKFSMTTHCGALFLREEFRDKVSLEYMQAILNNILPLHKEGEGSNKRLGVTRIEKIQINIPIDDKGNYYIEAQKKIAERYSKIKEIKENIKIELVKIENIKVDIGL
jgi:type I restriction-modification system DNA methylase subunit